METHSFRIVSGDLPETLRKLCVSAKFPYQEIRKKIGILLSEYSIGSLKANEESNHIF